MRKYLALSGFSGALCALAFSRADYGALALFALIPFFISLEKAEKPLLAVLAFALLYYIPLTLWLYRLTPYSSFPLISLGILLVALFQAGFMCLAFLPYSFLRGSLPAYVPLRSLLYLACEFLQGLIPQLSFPWGQLGAVVSGITPVIQSAGLLGGLFVSLIVLMTNECLCAAIQTRKIRYALLAALVFFANYGYGLWSFSGLPEADTRVALVQGGIGGMDKWTLPAEISLNRHLSLSCAALAHGPELIVWPESALPVNLSDYPKMRDTLSRFCIEHHVALLIGTFEREGENRYNAMFLFGADGKLSAGQYKRRLVPISEYMPLGDGLSIGKQGVLFPTLKGDIGGLICYESAYTGLSRQSVLSGAGLLCVISNDSWFDASPALIQHHAHALLRAVECGRYTLCSSATGLTSAIDPKGRVISSLPPGAPGLLAADISFIGTKTLYVRIGPIVMLLPLALYALALWRKLSAARIAHGQRLKTIPSRY